MTLIHEEPQCGSLAAISLASSEPQFRTLNFATFYETSVAMDVFHHQTLTMTHNVVAKQMGVCTCIKDVLQWSLRKTHRTIPGRDMT